MDVANNLLEKTKQNIDLKRNNKVKTIISFCD